MDKNQAKNLIQKLVDKYEAVLKSGEIKKYSEEDTKKGFIEPLFKVLGWDFENRGEVSAEEHLKSSGRVDYGFYLNNRTKFYLEAKPLKADIHKEEYANQAIRYSWNKGVNWAVLTNFETLKVFYSQDISKHLSDKLYFSIKHSEYLENFDQLWLLSKEAFEDDLIDKEAKKVGKILEKVSVSTLLYKDLNKCRDILTKAFSLWNENLSKDLLDEGVQKLLNRLVFIRVIEDRDIEPSILKPLLRDWKAIKVEKNKNPFYKSLVKKFRELDEIYNSNLFSPHPFENWEDYENATEKVIDVLYGKPGYYEYDFKFIPADVLGAVYENYLGYRLSQSKGVSIGKDAKKRKEHGIYYTPTFIVDYIVKNALQPVLDNCHSITDLKSIKVLDPACGSGSFLIKALEVINEKYKLLGQPGNMYNKIQILGENLYGVDLDEQAVEIARLNLLINSLDGQIKLPSLSNNVKNGNSLISGTDEELKKYFGSNFKDKKPFNWREEFPEVFKQGGFDVIIGNPPYVRNRDLPESDKKYFNDKFISAKGQYDIYQLFFERSIEILRNFRELGFITSNKYTVADYGKKIREFILENCKIKSIVDVSNLNVFKDASTYPYIIILEKNKDNSDNIIEGYKIENENNFEENKILIKQDEIAISSTKNFVIKTEPEFLKKIEIASSKLGDIATIKETIHTGNVREKLIVDKAIDDNCKKLLAGKDCHRYWFKWGGKYIRYDKSLIKKEKGDYGNLIDPKYFEIPKILFREIALNIECYLDEDKYYTLNKVYSVQLKEKTEFDLYFILAILNSKLLSFYFRNKFEEAHVQNGYLQFKKIYTSQLPIFKINIKDKIQKAKHDNLVKMARQISNLNKQILETAENSDKWQKIKDEIAKTDHEIDQKVYELYGLMPDEIKIVENVNS